MPSTKSWGQRSGCSVKRPNDIIVTVRAPHLDGMARVMRQETVELLEHHEGLGRRRLRIALVARGADNVVGALSIHKGFDPLSGDV